MLIGTGLYGVDLATVFFGTPWQSSLPHDRTATVLGGIIATVTIIFGSLFVAGAIALVVDREKKVQPAEKNAGSQP